MANPSTTAATGTSFTWPPRPSRPRPLPARSPHLAATSTSRSPRPRPGRPPWPSASALAPAAALAYDHLYRPDLPDHSGGDALHGRDGCRPLVPADTPRPSLAIRVATLSPTRATPAATCLATRTTPDDSTRLRPSRARSFAHDRSDLPTTRHCLLPRPFAHFDDAHPSGSGALALRPHALSCPFDRARASRRQPRLPRQMAPPLNVLLLLNTAALAAADGLEGREIFGRALRPRASTGWPSTAATGTARTATGTPASGSGRGRTRGATSTATTPSTASSPRTMPAAPAAEA